MEISNDLPNGKFALDRGRVFQVEIAPCGGALCGTVVRVMANHAMEGLSAPAASLARVGQVLMTAFSPSGPGQWTGKLFNRQDGKTYDCVIKPRGVSLTVHPYVGTPLFGKDLTWARAAG